MKHNWEYKKLGEVCDIKTGKLDANAASPNGEYPFFTCSKETLRIDNYSYDEECVLIAGNGDLNVKYYNGKFDAYQRTYIITLKDIPMPISMTYLYMFFSKYIEHLRQICIGGVIKYIKLNNLTECLIPLPPLPVQERIVEELDRLSLILEKKKQQIKELDSLAQSIFYDMFGDPIENEKGWEVKKLGEICSDKQHIIRANKYFSKTAKIQYIDISSINNSSNTITNTTTFVFENAPSRAQQKVEYGDVLISLVRPNLKNIASIDIMCNNLVASSGFCVLRGINVSQYYIQSISAYKSLYEIPNRTRVRS